MYEKYTTFGILIQKKDVDTTREEGLLPDVNTIQPADQCQILVSRK